MPTDPTDARLFARIERYYDAAPRSGAEIRDIGPFTLFVSTGMWPYYARPRLGLERDVTASDVSAMREAQRAIGVLEAFEWVVETTPSMSAAAREAGLAVDELPLLVLDRPVSPVAVSDASIRRIRADEFDLSRILAVASVAFANGGTAVAEIGPRERDAKAAADPLVQPRLRDRIRDGWTVMYVAEDDEGPVASGAHQPVDGVTEIVGVATLPSARRRGLGAAITGALIIDALEAGVTTTFLSASSDDVARIYERLGFVRIGSAGLASVTGAHP